LSLDNFKFFCSASDSYDTSCQLTLTFDLSAYSCHIKTSFQSDAVNGALPANISNVIDSLTTGIPSLLTLSKSSSAPGSEDVLSLQAEKINTIINNKIIPIFFIKYSLLF